jgi:HSP20 family molecular chaperone IbpA
MNERQQTRGFGHRSRRDEEGRFDHHPWGHWGHWGHWQPFVYDMAQAFQKNLRDLEQHRWEHMNQWHPRSDVTETKEAYVVHMDLPGISKEDVNINFEDNILTVSGTRKAEVEEKEVRGRTMSD